MCDSKMFDKERKKKTPRKNKHVSFCLLTYQTKKQKHQFFEMKNKKKRKGTAYFT